MTDERPLFRFKFVYRSLFGTEFSELVASNVEEANLKFWEGKSPELYRIVSIERSACEAT